MMSTTAAPLGALLARSLVLVLVVGACAGGDDAATTTTSTPAATPSTASTSATTPQPARPGVLLAAGDIASCASDGDEATAVLLDDQDGVIAALGDLAYDSGTPEEFADCFDPSWGRHRDRIRPAPGNHDYGTPDAGGYFSYFGEAAGSAGEGWYGYDLGRWRVIVLNSVCGAVGGCDGGSPQEQWLRAELSRHAGTECTLAYWHHPRFSSGRLHGSNDSVHGLVQALHDGGVDIVLAGHEHHYERFAPLDPTGAVDTERGIRHFVVGTGGNRLYRFDDPLPGSEVRFGEGYGVLRLELHDGSYAWEFLGVEGVDFDDSGSDRCR